MRLPEEVRAQAVALVERRLGLRLGEDRGPDLDRILPEVFRSMVLPSPEGLLAWLAERPSGSLEWGRLAARLTVGETYFFRDAAVFQALEERVLPALIEERRREGALRLRFWSAGCASGEEAYSLAILLDRLIPDRQAWAITVLASDVNPEALAAARGGRYREWALRATPAEVRERCFAARGGELEVAPRIRAMVTFAPLNLAEDAYPDAVTNTTAMDLVFCRNVLMYFTPEAQRAAAARLRRSLVRGGWLVLSPAEASAELLRPLLPVSFPGAILYRREGGLELPSSPVADAGAAAEWPYLEAGEPSHSSAPLAADLELHSTEETAVGEAPPAPEAATARPPTLCERARSLADLGRLEDARRLCEEALAEDRLRAEPHVLLAAIRQELGEISGAIESLRRALYVAPDSASAHFLLGALLWRQGEQRRGRGALEHAVRLLGALPADEAVPESGGLTAGRLKETALAYLEQV